MKTALSILAMCLCCQPAMAQDGPSYAPCLAAVDLDGVADAFRLAGWEEVSDTAEIANAQAAMGQTHYSLASPPERFENAADAAEYASIAAMNFEQSTSAATPVFVRLGIYAMARRIDDPDPLAIQCHLSAATFPEAEQLIAANDPRTGFAGGAFGNGVTYATIELDPSDGVSTRNSVDLLRLEGAPDVLPNLTGRYGIITTQFIPQPVD